jgi:hypothetical protein
MRRYLPRFLLIGNTLLFAVLVWLMFTEGLFDSESDLDERAAVVEDGPLQEPPFADALEGLPEAWPEEEARGEETDEETEEEEEDPNAPSLGLGGTVRIAANDLLVVDKRGRKVLEAKLAHTTAMLSAMKHGKFLVPKGLVQGAEVNLYRDAEGKISIASALRTAPPSVRRSLALPPVPDETTPEQWIMDVGPIAIRDAVLTIGFTERPVKIKVDRGFVRVEQGRHEEMPRIYFDQIEGAMLEPSPLPQPVRIAHAKGLVRLAGKPLVELAARACIGNSELRMHALVPKRHTAVRITADSAGLGGALGRMGLKIAGKKKSDKLSFQKGPVKLKGGARCKDPKRKPQAKAEP